MGLVYLIPRKESATESKKSSKMQLIGRFLIGSE